MFKSSCICPYMYLYFLPFSSQQSGPYRFQGRNDGFAGVSSSQESLVRLMEALNEVES